MAKFQTVKGMQDFLPEKMQQRLFVEQTCIKNFELYGFLPLQTPIIESLELLDAKGGGGEEIKKEIFAFKDQGDREIGLRFDLTVPLARVIASNPNIARPFKRYCVGTVYRYDQPAAGRYREFSQADADIIGVKGVGAEFELIALGIKILQEFGLKPLIRINNRKLLEEMLIASGFTKETAVEGMRLIDKMDKIGKNGVQAEFKAKNFPTMVLNWLEKDVKEMEELLGKKNANLEGLLEIKDLMKLIRENNLQKFVKIDFSLARGLEYYTGMVFEIAGPGFSIGSGGRYDNLIALYGGQPTPAVGISFGIERVMIVLEKENKLKLASPTKIFIIPINTLSKCLQIAEQMREEGIQTEVDLMGRNLGKNMGYVNTRGIPFCIILGEDEDKKNSMKLRDMKSGKESMVKQSEIQKIKKIVMEE